MKRSRLRSLYRRTAFPAWMRFGGTLFDSDELDPLLRELAIARVAAMTPGADYEWIQHAAITLAVGGTQEQLNAIERGDIDADVLGDNGRLVVRFTTQVVRDASPDEETFTAVTARFTSREIMHLLLVIGQYMMLGRIMATTQIDLEPALADDVLAGARRATPSLVIRPGCSPASVPGRAPCAGP